MAVHVAKHVSPARAFSGGYAVLLFEKFHILVGKAKRGDQAVIIHRVPVKIRVKRMEHGRLCQAQTTKKAHAKRHNGKNGKPAAKTCLDFTYCQLQHCLTTQSRKSVWDAHSA